MWKLLNKSFWSGMFWPPVVGEAAPPAEDLLPDGVWPTRLRSAQTQYQLTAETTQMRLRGEVAEYRLRFEG